MGIDHEEAWLASPHAMAADGQMRGRTRICVSLQPVDTAAGLPPPLKPPPHNDTVAALPPRLTALAAAQSIAPLVSAWGRWRSFTRGSQLRATQPLNLSTATPTKPFARIRARSVLLATPPVQSELLMFSSAPLNRPSEPT